MAFAVQMAFKDISSWFIQSYATYWANGEWLNNWANAGLCTFETETAFMNSWLYHCPIKQPKWYLNWWASSYLIFMIFYRTAIWGHESCLSTKQSVKIYTFFSRSNWKLLHLANSFYTASGCDGFDKYQVCWKWPSAAHRAELRSASSHVMSCHVMTPNNL